MARLPTIIALLFALTIECASAAMPLQKAIPSQPLQTALVDWATQTHLQVAYLASVVGKQHSPGAAAGLTPPAALEQLLRNTGLQFEFLSPHLAQIRPASPAAANSTNEGEEEITVSASIARSAADVPTSQLVWTREELDAAHIDDVVRLADLSPGVTFN